MSTATQQPVSGDPTLAEIAEGVHAAQQAILAKVGEDPHRPWEPAELMAVQGDFTPSKAMIAFWNLVREGDLLIDEQIVVRAPHLV